MSAKPMDLEQYLLEKAPSSIFYIPNFINETEETDLLKNVYAAPKPKWTHLSHRRLQNWGGLPHTKGMISEPLPSWLQIYAEKTFELGIFNGNIPNHVLVNEYLPGQGIMPHEDGPLFFPTVATISLGSHTMLDFFYHMDHKSTEIFNENRHCSSSLNSSSGEGGGAESTDENQRLLNEERHFISILLERRSLILVCNEMYKLHLHGIGDRKEDIVTDKVANLTSVPYSEGDRLERKTRVSLTIRNVPKILKSKLLFGKR